METIIGFQSYQARSTPYSNQRLMNLFFEAPVEGVKSPGVLYRRPGLVFLAELSSDFVRGIHTVSKTNVTYIVAGTLVYTLDQSNTLTILSGNVTGTELVDMADNGDQVAIVAGGAGWIADGTSVTEITDTGFRPVSSVEYQDGYFIWTETDTGRLFWSPLFNGLGPYDPLDFATAEYGPDNLVKVFSDHGDLFLFGERTVEVWRNSGNSDQPFTALKGASMEVGLISRNTVAKIDNSIMWLGFDDRGGITVWRANGYTPQRVSTHALEAEWDRIADDLFQSYAMTIRIEGHAFYLLTVRNRGTWAFDASTGLWHEWSAKGANDWPYVGFGAAGNRRIVGDRSGRGLYSVSMDANDDNGTAIPWFAITPPVHTENNSLARHNFVRIDARTGVGPADGYDPQIFISWADENGDEFSSPKLMSMGKRGETRKRMYRRRLGQARSRTYKISGADSIPLSLIGAYIDVDAGLY